MSAQRKYPDELRERAVKMVFEIRERDGKGHGELARVGRQLGVHPEALRSWLKQAEIDGGERPGTTTGDKQRITELEREVRSAVERGEGQGGLRCAESVGGAGSAECGGGVVHGGAADARAGDRRRAGQAEATADYGSGRFGRVPG